MHLTKTLDKDLIEIIPIHFDVPQHYLPLNEFIATARSTELIIDGFNKALFDGKLKYQIFVLPPDEGSFLSKIGLAVCGLTTFAGGLVLNSLITEKNVDAYINAYSDHPASYWFEEAGKKTKELTSENAKEKKQAELILSECTKGFLKKNPELLSKVTELPKDSFRQMYNAKNNFYNACYSNKDIKGIGFDNSEQFTVVSSNFPQFIVEIPTNDNTNTEDKIDWKVEIKHIIVTSPDWELDTKLKGLWKARNDNNKNVFFDIEDNIFWALIERGQLKTKGIDNLKVQWAFDENKSKKHRRVLKVLEYNGQKISNPLTDAELDLLLASHTKIDNDLQIDLFNYIETPKYPQSLPAPNLLLGSQ